MSPLSPPARVALAVVGGLLIVLAIALYVVDLFTYASSTGGLVFLFAVVYGGIAYGIIFADDVAVRIVLRRARSLD